MALWANGVMTVTLRPYSRRIGACDSSRIDQPSSDTEAGTRILRPASMLQTTARTSPILVNTRPRCQLNSLGRTPGITSGIVLYLTTNGRTACALGQNG